MVLRRKKKKEGGERKQEKQINKYIDKESYVKKSMTAASNNGITEALGRKRRERKETN